MIRLSGWYLTGLAVAAYFVLAAPAMALPITFTKVADTSTAIPGGSGTFTNVTNC